MGPTPHPPFLEKSKEELKLHKVEEEEMTEIGIQWAAIRVRIIKIYHTVVSIFT